MLQQIWKPKMESELISSTESLSQKNSNYDKTDPYFPVRIATTNCVTTCSAYKFCCINITLHFKVFLKLRSHWTPTSNYFRWAVEHLKFIHKTYKFVHALKFRWILVKVLPHVFEHRCILLKCLKFCINRIYLCNVLMMKLIKVNGFSHFPWKLKHAVHWHAGNHNTNINSKHLTTPRKWCITSVWNVLICVRLVFSSFIHFQALFIVGSFWLYLQ